MISVDGREFAALPEKAPLGLARMKVFSFGQDGKGCELRDTFDFSTGKTIFGHTGDGKPKADLAYEYNRQIWWYQREIGKEFNIAPYTDANSPQQEVLASAFPGMTKDGRVIYAATWKECRLPTQALQQGRSVRSDCRPRSGYILSDPWQSNAFRSYAMQKDEAAHPKKYPQCIEVAKVRSTRQNQAQFWGISQ
jgi:hypothetical protein